MPADRPPDLAGTLLGRARADAAALARLSSDEGIDDAIVGFHAQQAVEKSVKAVLAAHSVDFPFVHDIGRLVRLLDTAGVDRPSRADEAIELSPWAAEPRYGEVFVESVDRSQLTSIVEAVLEWAHEELDRARR